MHPPRLISVVAVLGVLFNAGGLARHQVGMLGAGSALTPLLRDLARICHGGEAAPPDGPAAPSPLEPFCSVCAAPAPVASPHTVAAASLAIMLVPAMPRAGITAAERISALRPWVRGPPSPGLPV
jgi:hypothetical protein